MIYVTTDRLKLRQWQASDLPLMADMNADSRVMQHFPALLSRYESDDAIDKMTSHINRHGYGFWAAELRSSGDFIGFIGLKYNADGLPFAPCVEIGWRLAHQYWGQGLATEGARGALKFAFTQPNIEQLVSITTTTNAASERVMNKLGMSNTGENFKHPGIAAGHRLEEHVLYLLTRDQWLRAAPD